MAQKLDNYLRTFRRRAGLAQHEVAFLLGTRNGTRVGRYERSTRLPLATTVFAYEVAFGVPARELFAGIYERVERATIRRALALAEELQGMPKAPRNSHKLESLKAIYVPFTETQQLEDESAG